MATQHPDHGAPPFWQRGAFIPTIEETKECVSCFKDLHIDEYMWDWEGKLVDESVFERIIADHYDFFQKFPLGKNKFLTFRLPNPKVQHEFRMSRALMGILTASGLARQTELHSPPLFEVILPMTETAEELISIQEAFREIACLRHPLNRMNSNCEMFLEIIPLFETVHTIINSHQLLGKYLKLYQHKFKTRPAYMRPFVARSDPALNSGIVPTVLAIKIAFSRYARFAKQHKLKLYPIIGAGTLPFRGGLNPLTPEDFTQEYSGVRTATIQSAFRYDFPKTIVKNSLKYFNNQFPKNQLRKISHQAEKDLIRLLEPFEVFYKKTIEGIAPVINQVAGHFPKRRERVQHIGLFGYSRGSGKVRLPRAITFTGSLYSLGIPPELIGTGRGLKKAVDGGAIGLIEKNYLNLTRDLEFAGGFLYKPGLIALSKKIPAFKNIWEDVQEIESYLLTELGPKTQEQKAHYKLCEKLHKQLFTKQSLTKLIEKQAVLRHSLG
jgi:phosphoenolpyruvate carboxylase